MMQAYVDSELSPSDRVILEQHLAGCAHCADQVKRHRRLSADLFESFSEFRLSRNLRTPVLEHLPEMEVLKADLGDVNRRTKNPITPTARAARLLPVAAVAILLIFGFMINLYWPRRPVDMSSLGVIMQAKGHTARVPDSGTDWLTAYAEERVRPGDRFETGDDSTLMVGLKGSTVMKLNARSRIKIDTERRVNLETGEIWLDVGRDGQLFRVITPDGSVTVFGTAFTVRVLKGTTTVAVQRGEVLVGSETSFTNLRPGERVSIKVDHSLTKPESVEPDSIAAWAKAIVPEESADAAYKALVLAQTAKTELAAQEVFFVDTSMGGHKWAIRAINVYWEDDEFVSGHCAYDVYVYNDQMAPLFKDRIAASVLDIKGKNVLEITVPGAPIQNVRWLFVRLVPDLSEGRVEAKGLNVRALASQL
jgi:hypothetical protein